MDLSVRYQLPDNLKIGRKSCYQCFLFLGTKEMTVQAVVNDLAERDWIERIEVRCEAGIPEDTLSRFREIFDNRLPAEGNIEVVFETEMPKYDIYQCWLHIKLEAERNRAILN